MSSRQLTVAKNRLEQNCTRREQAEIEDFFAERTRRLQEQEEEDDKRYQQQVADGRKREDKAAAEKRREFYSKWLEHALQEKPYRAPAEVELDIHEEVDATAKGLFHRLQNGTSTSFSHGQLRSLRRRVRESRTAIARRLVVGAGGATEDVSLVSDLIPSTE